MRSWPARLFRVSPAALVLSHLGTKEIADERTLLPPCGNIGSSTAGYAKWASETVENLARCSGPGPPTSQGGHGGKDISLSVFGIGILKARRLDTQSVLARLLRVSLAFPVLGRLGAEKVTEGRILPPACAALEARRRDIRCRPARLLIVLPAAPVLGRLGVEEVTERRTLPLRVRYWRQSGPYLRSGPGRLAVTLSAAPVLCRLGARGRLGERTLPSREDIRVVSRGDHHRARRRMVATGPQLQWLRRGKQRRGRVGVLHSAGPAAVRPVQPRTADPEASTNHNAGLAAFRPAHEDDGRAQKKSTPVGTGSAARVAFPTGHRRRTPLFVVVASSCRRRSPGRRRSSSRRFCAG